MIDLHVLFQMYCTFFFAAIAWIGFTGIARRGGFAKRVRLTGGWGTVYLFHDRENPHLLKVGTTRRLSKVRKGEVSERMTGGCHLAQVYAVDMPYARAVETLAHRRLRRYRHFSERGREWYRLEGEEGIERAIDAINAAAQEVRKMAKRQRRWSAEADIKARSWRLTPEGPERERLFQKKSR